MDFRIIALLFGTFSKALFGNVDFESDILPLFEDYCYDCHGPDKEKSGFRTDKRVHLLKGGDTGLAAIVPGNVQQSYLIEVIKSDDPEIGMPPKGGKLFDDEIELLENWIEEGAVWPGQMNDKIEEGTDHWSFQKIIRPNVPSNSDHPVDAYLNKRLESEEIPRNGPASPYELVRRASIVLTGMLPQPERVKSFIADYEDSPEKSFIALINELLDSPHFGERWAQHWLDVIRWAETNGSESNLYRKLAWVYRDYVIRSFNNDIPYDQFVREQLAGDGLGVGEALGFLVAGPHVPAATVGQEPAAIRQARADRMDEIIQTVGASLLGVTMSCARCHNHKFDPVSIQDYYSMSAVFQDIEFGSRFPELDTEHPRKKNAQKIWKDISKNRRFIRNNIGFWEEDWGGFKEIHWEPEETSALRVEFLSGYVAIDEVEVFGLPVENQNLAIHTAGAKVQTDPGFAQEGDRYPVSRLIDGKYGTQRWRASFNKTKKEKPWFEMTFKEAVTLGRLRISSNRERFFETDYLTQKKKYNFDGVVIKSKTSSGGWKILFSGPEFKKRLKKEKLLGEAVKEINHFTYQLSEEGPRPSFVGSFVKVQPTRVFHRGSPENPRDLVSPGGPKILNGDLGLAESSSGRARRSAFSEWVVDPQNPLTARVMANRIWQHIFGYGLVMTGSDFGRAGAPPTHPELLDWLAAEFIAPQNKEAEPWSVKDFIRLLVTSEAFKRSSKPSEIGMQRDAGSGLLWRYPPRRMEAEVIRDGILLASGKLDSTMGGRSYRIHNVKKDYAQWEVVDNFGPETWRRMIYQERMRRVDDQIFTAFDFPDCGQVRDKRPVSTTPLQALNLMNSSFVVEQSKYVADRALAEVGSDNLKDAISRCFELLLSRQPDDSELSYSLVIATKQGLDIVCRALINTNEFSFIP